MTTIELAFDRCEHSVPGIKIWVSRVPAVGEEIEFSDDFRDQNLAGCSFTVTQVSFQVAQASALSTPLLVVREG